MKTLYTIIVLVSIFIFTIVQGFGQKGGLPLFNYEGKTIIHKPMVIEEVPISEFTLPVTIVDSIAPTGPSNGSGPIKLNGEDRKVFWIHGLAGTKYAWIKAAYASEFNVPGLEDFPPRKLTSITDITYPEDAGMLSAAFNLNETIEGKFDLLDDKSQSFIISHSQGGVLARSYYHMLLCENSHIYIDSLPGGYVTFSSPHKGAQIINNYTEGGENSKGKLFLRNMTKKLTSPWLHYEILNLPTIEQKFIGINIKINPKTFISYDLVDRLTGKMEDLFVTGLNTAIENSFLHSTTEDYKVGAAHLQKLEESCPIVKEDVHKIAFYGVEPQKHIFARTLQYLINEPNIRDYDYFGANSDFDLLHDLQEIQSKFTAGYKSVEDEASTLRKKYEKNGCKEFEGYYVGAPYNGEYGCDDIYKSSWGWIFGGALGGLIGSRLSQSHCYKCWKDYKEIKEYEKVKDKFKEGADWFDTVDQEWQDLIGALEMVKITSGTKSCECEDEDKLGDIALVRINSNEECSVDGVREIRKRMGERNWKCWELEGSDVIGFKLIVHPNDGILLADTQRSLPYMTLKEDVDPVLDLKMDDTSHMQVRNNEALKEKLEQLYNGEYDLFFKTDERD